MEIEFNANSVNKPRPATQVTRTETVQRVQENTSSFRSTEALESKLRELPVVRPEKVEQARSLVADVKYPPDQVLTSLAHLLAMKIR